MKYFLLLFFLFFSSVYAVSEGELIDLVKKDLIFNDEIDSVDVEIYSSKKVVEEISEKEILQVSRLTRGYKNYQKYRVLYKGGAKNISLKINFYKEIPVASKLIKKDDILDSSDAQLSLVNITNVQAFILHKDQISHKIAKRNFLVGEFFQEASLKDVPPVIKDKKVKVVVNNNSVNLSFDAVAYNSGEIGEQVYFRNPFNDKLQLGIVVSVNVIKIK